MGVGVKLAVELGNTLLDADEVVLDGGDVKG